MVININGSNRLKITDGMKNAIEEKLSFLDKFLEQNDRVSIKVGEENKTINVSSLFVYNGQTVKITENGSDFYCILDKLESKLKVKIEKLHTQKVKRNRDQEDAFKQFETTPFEEFVEDDSDNLPPIEKEKIVSGKPMTEKDALRQMEENGYPTYIFINADKNNTYCSLYTRYDGTIGLMILSED